MTENYLKELCLVVGKKHPLPESIAVVRRKDNIWELQVYHVDVRNGEIIVDENRPEKAQRVLTVYTGTDWDDLWERVMNDD